MYFTETFTRVARDHEVTLISLTEQGVEPSELDGIHLSANDHKKIAEILKGVLIFPTR